jgi:sigma-B regulation protein RsbQ
MNPAQLLDATVTGSGPRTVVFGNGFATTQRAWDAIVPHVPAGWRVVRFDYVGTTPGTTPQWIPERYASYAGHADDLRRLLVHLDVRDGVFVGHSMSGMVGAIVAADAPERLAHLLMLGASPCYANIDDYHGGFAPEEIDEVLRQVDADLAAWMAGFGGLAMGRDAKAHQLHAYTATFLAMRPDIGRTLVHSIFRSDHRALLERVTAETTIVQTAEDAAIPLTVFEYLVAHTPCTSQHVLPVSGHLPHVTHPQLLAPIVRALLERLDRPGHTSVP